jgi:hypothetical protein
LNDGAALGINNKENKNMDKEKLKEIYKHWFRGNGLFHNADGSVSDRWVLAYIITIVDMIIILVWAFGKEPKLEYAYNLLNKNVTIVLPLLLGVQTVENCHRKNLERKRGMTKEEQEDKEAGND